MREFLVRVVEQVRRGREMSADDLAQLNRFLAAAPVVRRLELGDESSAVAARTNRHRNRRNSRRGWRHPSPT